MKRWIKYVLLMIVTLSGVGVSVLEVAAEEVDNHQPMAPDTVVPNEAAQSQPIAPVEENQEETVPSIDVQPPATQPQVDNTADFKIQTIPYTQTLSDYPDDTSKIMNSHSEAKTNAGLNQLMVEQANLPATYKSSADEIESGKVIKSQPTVFTTLGGANHMVAFYNSIEDAVNKNNPIPISGASYDGWYEDTFKQDGVNLAKVKIGGMEGYVDVSDIQIIPPTLVKARSFYQKENNNWIYYEANDPIMSDQYTTYNLGKAPRGVKNNTKYVLTGDEEYTPMDGGKSVRSFNYFQNLPGRVTTSYNANDFKRYLASRGRSDSQYYNATQAFFDAQNLKGVNALLLFAMANHESAYGTSYFARSCNNYYGRGAYDSDPGQACKIVGFDRPYDGAAAQAFFLSNDFFDTLDWRYYGSHPGNKASGMNVKYASDPNWGAKLASHMQQADAYLGSKDYNKYSIATTNGSTVYKDAALQQVQKVTGAGKPINDYNTRPGIPVVVTGSDHGNYEIQLDNGRNLGPSGELFAIMAQHGQFPQYDGNSPYGAFVPNGVSSFCTEYKNFDQNQGYVPGNSLTILNHHNFISPQDVSQDSKYPIINNNVQGPIAYSVYQNGKWQDPVGNNNIIGDVNSDSPITAITIDNKTNLKSLPFRTHVSMEGWKSIKDDGEISGSDHLDHAVEAIQLDPNTDLLNNYDVYYRVHSKSFGWMDWAKNGNISGSVGKATAINAMQVYVVNKGATFAGSFTQPYICDTFTYQTHHSLSGWSTMLSNNDVSEDINNQHQLEAIRIFLPTNIQGNVDAQAYCQDYGWIQPVHNGEVIGTVGQSKRMESYRLHLTGDISNRYQLVSKAFVSGFGYTSVGQDNDVIGSQHIATPMYQVVVRLIDKNDKVKPTKNTLVSDIFSAQGHVESIGWMPNAYPGQIVGTQGRGLRLEAIKIFNQFGDNSNITYQAHVQDIGWQDWVKNGELAGTQGRSLRMEALRIKLEGRAASYYDVYYRAHVQNIGWQNWVKNGELAGTQGRCLRMEALEIKIVLKSNYQNTDIELNRRGA